MDLGIDGLPDLRTSSQMLRSWRSDVAIYRQKFHADGRDFDGFKDGFGGVGPDLLWMQI